MNILRKEKSRMSEFMPSTGNVLRAPLYVATRGQRFFSGMFKDSVEVFLPYDTPQTMTRKMELDQPIHEAKLGIRDRHRGRENNDPALVQIGGLIMANATLKGYRKPDIPDSVTEEVLEMALEDHVYEDQTYKGHEFPAVTPLLSEPDIKDTEKMMQKFHIRNVFPLFPNCQN